MKEDKKISEALRKAEWVIADKHITPIRIVKINDKK